MEKVRKWEELGGRVGRRGRGRGAVWCAKVGPRVQPHYVFYGELASKLHVNFVGVDTGMLEEF